MINCVEMQISTMAFGCGNLICSHFKSEGISQTGWNEVPPSLLSLLSSCRISFFQRRKGCAGLTTKVSNVVHVKCFRSQGGLFIHHSTADGSRKTGKEEHHLWKKKDSAGSGQKALNLVRSVSELPNEKEAVYRALDKWIAWETEFPSIAVAKALRILRKRRQWLRVIQVAKWMLSKGQGATMGTYDTILLAFDMDGRVDEAESLWNMILHTHRRSISKRLFSRMISLYDHHGMEGGIIEVFADMEELGVRPDEDTVRRVARAFKKQGQDEKKDLVLQKHLSKRKYVHFKGERIRVRRNGWDEG